jgi:hypothetical protein
MSHSIDPTRTAPVFDVRPVRPADSNLIADAVAYTSEESYYRRFHVIKHGLRARELSRAASAERFGRTLETVPRRSAGCGRPLGR